MLWKIKESNLRLQEQLSDALGVSGLFAQLLINRDLRTSEQAQNFLFGKLASCHDPFLMKGMERAVERIKRAIGDKEKILVYGDYDVDGLTSMALISDILRKMGADCETFVPNRLEEGYGLNMEAMANIVERKVDLILTVDCGINSVEEIEYAAKHGVDVVITDHHTVKEGLTPLAYAIIDPHQKDCKYPYDCSRDHE